MTDMPNKIELLVPAGSPDSLNAAGHGVPYCPARDICSGGLCIKEQLYITDCKNEEWDVIYNPIKHSVRIFNPHHIMLTESVPFIKESGISSFRSNLIDETSDEVYEIIRAARVGTRLRLNPEYDYTRGHY